MAIGVELVLARVAHFGAPPGEEYAMRTCEAARLGSVGRKCPYASISHLVGDFCPSHVTIGEPAVLPENKLTPAPRWVGKVPRLPYLLVTQDEFKWPEVNMPRAARSTTRVRKVRYDAFPARWLA